MKKTIIVVAVVTAYCLLLASIALLTMTRAPKFYSSALAESLMLGQYALIPGVAVIFSQLIHGRRGWVKRACFIFAVGVFGGPLLPFLIGLIVTPLVLLSEFSVPVGAVLSLLVLSLVVCGLRWGVRRLGRRSVENEANRWLAERQGGVTRNESKRQRQIIGWSLWIPSATVLLVFLFLPELWGVASHVVHPNMGQASEYRLSVPFGWILTQRESDFRENPPVGESWIFGLAGTGTGRSFSNYLRRDFLSGWDIRTEPCGGPMTTSQGTPERHGAVATRRLGTGAKQFTCIESSNPHSGGASDGKIYVYCSGPPRLHVSLCCDRRQVPAFYHMLETLDYSGDAPPCPVTSQQ